MKKFNFLLLSVILCLCLSCPVFAQSDEFLECAYESTFDSGIEGRFISFSHDFLVAVGYGWNKDFNTRVTNGTDHNAFKVKISNFNGGSYKIIVRGSNGYSFTSSEYTGGSTITITNANPSVRYTVTIINTCDHIITGHVTISSFLN